jgi:hypothetical protein
MVASKAGAGDWVLLTYRLPREPSTPRASVWRKLRRLGVAQLADGLVALPEDARTREHLEWIADEVLAAGGTAIPKPRVRRPGGTRRRRADPYPRRPSAGLAQPEDRAARHSASRLLLRPWT